MIVVADTTSLNYLVLMQRAGTLENLYRRVLIPAAVQAEMLAVGANAEVRAWAAAPPGWVEVVRAIELDVTLPKQLGAGEREAISLALAIRADVVLMDDHSGRLSAEARGLFVSGTLSVLLQAARSDLLNFEAAIFQLKTLGFRMSDEVENTMRFLSKRSKG